GCAGAIPPVDAEGGREPLRPRVPRPPAGRARAFAADDRSVRPRPRAPAVVRGAAPDHPRAARPDGARLVRAIAARARAHAALGGPGRPRRPGLLPLPGARAPISERS